MSKQQHIVQVRYAAGDLSAAMANMRTWLDDNRLEPTLFEVAFLPGREMRFRLQFADANHARHFACAFDGQVLDAGADRLAA